MSKKKYLLLVPCLAAVCAASVTAGVVSLASGDDGWSDYTLDEVYGYKTAFEVADRTFTVDGESYDATAVVCYPDGKVATGKSVLLDQAGIYTVKYSVQAGDKVYADSDTFLVHYPAYDAEKPASTVSYGTPSRASTPGIIAELAQGDKLVFTEYIDFTKVALGDDLVRGYVTPSAPGAVDFSELTITFTDSVDPSVYFQVHHYGYDWTYNTYVAANGENQQPSGIHQSEGLHTGDGYGVWSCVPFNSVGQLPNSKENGVIAPDASQFFVTMDYQQKAVYGQGFITQTSLILDLDDLSMVKQAWQGFPSGKARLSISVGGNTGASASLCITNVFGITDLSNNVYVDSGDPVITVDEEFAESMPKAMVGHNYRIPDATAYDAYALDCPVTAEVWYNYGQPNAVNVPVKDGVFTTDKVGTYAIVYKASDRIGNTAEAVKYVRAFTELDAAQISIPDEKTTSASVGEWVNVPVLTADAVTGAEMVTVAAYVEKDGKRTAIEEGFRPESAGTYKVVYVVTDYVGNTSEDGYDVTVTVSDKPILENDFATYPIYISGGTYTLPAYYAYTYENGSLQRKLCDVVITDGNGEHTYQAGEDAIITVANQGDPIQIAVKCDGETLSTHTAAGVLAWIREEVGLRFHCENYLYGEGFTYAKTSASGIILTATQEESFGYTFANALSARYVSMSFNGISGADADTTLTVTLTDALNADNKISVTLGAQDDNTYFEVDGVKHTVKGTAFAGGTLSVAYENGAFSVNGVTVAISGFEGFESDKVFLSVEYAGYGDGGAFTFVTLGNVTFSTAQTDRMGPDMFTRKETGGSHQQGELYTISSPILYDVYSPNIVATLSVTDSTGAYVKDVNGLLLKEVDPTKDYQLSLDVIGRYQVTYIAHEDESFVKRYNEVPLNYTLTVRDETAPTITWKGSFASELTVGETIILPEYEVADNHSTVENIRVFAYVETPAHQLLMLPGNSLRVTHAGEYTVRVMVVDEEGNITVETRQINVKEA